MYHCIIESLEIGISSRFRVLIAADGKREIINLPPLEDSMPSSLNGPVVSTLIGFLLLLI
jgi:hypothetical protein